MTGPGFKFGNSASAPIDSVGRGVRLRVNVDGLSEHCRLLVTVLDERFRPVPGYGAESLAVPLTSGFGEAVRWREHEAIELDQPFRLRFDFEGLRSEDVRLYAAYLGGAD